MTLYGVLVLLMPLSRNALNILPSYTDYFHLTTTTLSLNTAATWMGGGIICLFYGSITDLIGRRPSLIAAAALTIFAAVLQAAAQNIAMFVTARILLGMGMGAATVSGPTYLAETLPSRRRALGLGIFFTFYYVGKSPVPFSFLFFFLTIQVAS